nr:DUF3710 domain-containing protein [Pseudonocardiales bacterium]
MTERAYDVFDLGVHRPTAPPRLVDSSFGGPADPFGNDAPDQHPELDFGPLRVRVPAEAYLRMADDNDAAYFIFPEGQVRLSLLAVPRGGRLWPDRAEQIATAQAARGADVTSVWGAWGRELRIVSNGETNWVIGVDGERWMLLGRATWPAGGVEFVETMRGMISGSVVERGDEPLPALTPLYL